MTKRACPFDTTIYRQSKIHISDYDNDINTRKEIEDKTLKKLMTGGQYLLSGTCSIQAFQADNFHPICAVAGPSTSSGSRNKIVKQQQVMSYFTNGKKPSTENSLVPKQIVEDGLVCSFCDNKTENVHQCLKCEGNFCQSCSFISYGKSEDVWICMSCS